MTLLEPRSAVGGTTRFVRYTSTPNRPQYCGDDNRTILDYAGADVRQRQAMFLERYTARHLRLANQAL